MPTCWHEQGSIRIVGAELIVTGEYQYSCSLIDFAIAKDNSGPTSVGISDDVLLPVKYNLFQNMPNPFNPETAIEFEIPKRSHISLQVFNILGQRLKTLAHKSYSAGKHSVYWDGTNENGQKLATGVYFLRLQSEEYVETKKLILLK